MPSTGSPFMAEQEMSGTFWLLGLWRMICTLIMCAGSFRFHDCSEWTIDFVKLILNKTSTVVRLYIANVLNRVLGGRLAVLWMATVQCGLPKEEWNRTSRLAFNVSRHEICWFGLKSWCDQDRPSLSAWFCTALNSLLPDNDENSGSLSYSLAPHVIFQFCQERISMP